MIEDRDMDETNEDKTMEYKEYRKGREVGWPLSNSKVEEITLIN